MGWLLVGLYGSAAGDAGAAPGAGESSLAPWLLVSLVLLALMPLAALALRRPAVLAAGALLLGLFLPLGMNRIALQRSPRELGLTLKEHWQPGAALAGVYFYSQGLSFYSGQIFHLLDFRTELNFGEKNSPGERPVFSELGGTAGFRGHPAPAVFYLRNKDFARLRQWLPREFTVLARQNERLLVSSPRK